MTTLLLFDIDGTLVQDASREHAIALRGACEAVHGISLGGVRIGPTPVEAAGRTDGEIARLLLLDAGVSATRIDDRAADVQDECCRRFAELCPTDLSDRVAPGLPRLLETLAGRDDVLLALLTGNYEPVARVKLRHAGVGHWFGSDQGAFGSDSEDRTMLPPIARRRAGRDGVSWPRSQTIVIGDTPRDVACAQADDVRCIAVTTGPFGVNDLGGADAVAASAGDLLDALAGML